MLDRLFGRTTDVMARAMDGLSARQRAIAENVANADTPNYHRLEVQFEGQLAAATGRRVSELPLRRTQAGHLGLEGPSSLADFQIQTSRADDSTMRNDGNNVDPDTEMMRLAQSSMTYNAMADLMKRKLSGIKDIIRGQ